MIPMRIPDIAFLRRLFAIRSGEGGRAVLMQLSLFFVIVTLLIVKPTVSALFLSEVGVDQLPFVFLLTALAAAAVSLLYARLLPYFSLGPTLIGTLLITVASLLLFSRVLARGYYADILLYAAYVWVAISALLIASQFWLLANAVFNDREAKRLFGFIGAGGILGGICGGYLTSLLAPRIGTANLLIVAAGTLSCCLPLCFYIWRRYVARVRPKLSTRRRPRLVGGTSALQLIRKDPHLLNLTLLISMGVFVAKLIDYQFGAIASATYPRSEELAAFFGFWFSNFNILSLLIQLFLTRFVLQHLGVVRSLFLLPGAILLGALAVLFAPVLLSGILLKMADASGKQSLNKAALELLFLPVATNVKERVKTFIDVFVDSVATGGSGLLLIFVVKGLGLSVRMTSLLVLVGVVGWLFAVGRMRKTYLAAFQARVVRQPLRDRTARELDHLTLEGLLRILDSGTPRQIVYSLKHLHHYPDQRHFAVIRHLLAHDHPAVRAAAIEQLSHYATDEPVGEIKNFLAFDEAPVRMAALRYLLGRFPERAEHFLLPFRHHPEDRLRGAAMLVLAESVREQADPGRLQLLATWLDQESNPVTVNDEAAEDLFWSETRLAVIGTARLTDRYPELRTVLQEASWKPIVRAAIQAAGRTRDPDFIDPLLNRLPQKQYKSRVREALAHFDANLIDEIEAHIEADRLPHNVLREVPRLFSHWEAEMAVPALLRLADHSMSIVSLESLRALNRLIIRRPQVKVASALLSGRLRRSVRRYREILGIYYGQRSIQHESFAPGGRRSESTPGVQAARAGLIRLLERRLNGHLEGLFRLLALRYSPVDLLHIYKDIRLGDAAQRASALEFLDNILEQKWRRRVLPLVETMLQLGHGSQRLEAFPFPVPSERDGLALLLTGHDVRLKLAALYLIEQRKDDSWQQLVHLCRNDADIRVRRAAERALASWMS